MFANEPFGGLIPGAYGAVLATLLRTSTPMTGRQVHRVAGASQQTAQRVLHDLVRLGIAEVQPAGSARLYTLNRNHAAVPALRQLVHPLNLLRDVITDAVAETRGKAQAVILFGSVARGEATRESDIDLLVIADEDWNGRGGLRHAVSARFGGECDVLQYTTEQFVQWAQSGEEPVLRKVVREGIPMWGKMPRVQLLPIKEPEKEENVHTGISQRGQDASGKSSELSSRS
jgi:predicted nucleotidyltransferase